MSWKGLRRGAVVSIILGGVVLNGLAYLHARGFTEFARDGRRTGDVARLSFVQKLSVLATGPSLPRPRIRETPLNFDLAFETHHFRTRDGVRLEAWRVAAAEEPHGMVILFHGYADSKSSLLAEAAAFHAMGYDTLLVDFRGSGGSEGGTTTLGFDEAEDVWTSVVNAVRWPSSHRLFLFGSSMGGAAVLRAAALHALPVRGLIVQASFARLVTAVERRFEQMGAPTFPAAHLLLFWGGWQRGFNGFAHDPVRYAEQIRVPVLLLQGGRDAHASMAEAESIYAHLAGPRRLVVFPRAAHQSLYRQNRPLWRSAMASFLQS